MVSARTAHVLLAAVALAGATTNSGRTGSVFDRGLVTTTVSADGVIDHHDSVGGDSVKRFPRSTIGIVTPWHPDGRRVAQRFASKFTYVSPLWFHIEPERVQGAGPNDWKILVKPVGDPSESWAKELQDKGVKVVPMFAFYGWTQQTLSTFFLGKEAGTAQHQVVRQIVSNCKAVGCDGVHIEWGAMPINEHFAKLEPWLRRLRGTMRKMLGIGAQTLMLGVYPDPGLFGKGEFEALAPTVDHFLLNLYNFTGPAMGDGPAAPITWFEEVLDAWQLRKRKDVTDKVFVMLNFFGKEYRPDAGLAVDDFREKNDGVARDDQGQVTRWDITGQEYIRLLEDATDRPQQYQLETKWDEEKAEHYTEYLRLMQDAKSGQRAVERRRVWYPSLQSIQRRVQVAEKARALGLGVYNLGTGLDYFYELI